MTWLLTATGREHHLGACSALRPGNTPQIEEIAHALAQINRYTGHAARPYSVAEHSLLVCDLVQAAGFDCHAQMAALLHDAHEAFCGDAATPVKQVLGVAWMAFENTQALLVREAFQIRAAHTAHRAAIKRADLVALATERRDLLPFAHEACMPWPVLDTPGNEVPPAKLRLNTPEREAHPWHHWRDAFIVRFARLDAARLQAFTAIPATTPA
ncbi:MAG TPA: hypothetical protein DET46_06555 [Comamonadaceae bacterium]|nr:MAG: hypothetical protein A3F76_07610 [Burkholderiales bacterium RIFCSPLOWO2_12_FULL_65_40]HCE28458.1 hypothetical protein [Comamonadaceae bacterium]